MIIGQDAGDGMQPKLNHCVEMHWSVAQLGYILQEMAIKFVDLDWLEYLWAERKSRICLYAKAAGLAEVHV